jgi:hypothetical protein
MKAKVVPLHTMQAYRGSSVWLDSFLTTVLDGGEWLTSRPGHFNRGGKKKHFVRGWVGPRASLDGLEKTLLSLLGFEPRTVQPVAMSLYRLRYIVD